MNTVLTKCKNQEYQKMIDTTLAKLVELEDKQGKAHTKEWERLEGYYYGLLDAGTSDCVDCCHENQMQKKKEVA